MRKQFVILSDQICSNVTLCLVYSQVSNMLAKVSVFYLNFPYIKLHWNQEIVYLLWHFPICKLYGIPP